MSERNLALAERSHKGGSVGQAQVQGGHRRHNVVALFQIERLESCGADRFAVRVHSVENNIANFDAQVGSALDVDLVRERLLVGVHIGTPDEAGIRDIGHSVQSQEGIGRLEANAGESLLSQAEVKCDIRCASESHVSGLCRDKSLNEVGEGAVSSWRDGPWDWCERGAHNGAAGTSRVRRGFYTAELDIAILR